MRPRRPKEPRAPGRTTWPTRHGAAHHHRVHPPRRAAARPIARWLADVAAARDDVACELVDLAAFSLPLLSAATPPMSPNAREDAAREWATTIDERRRLSRTSCRSTTTATRGR